MTAAADNPAVDYGDKFRHELEEQAISLTDQILHAGSETFDDYRYACGLLHGLERALSVFDEMRKRERRDEDE